MDYKKLREKKDYTQEYVAIKVGISLYTYQLIERGITQTPRKETLTKLKEILNNGNTSN